MASNSNRVVYPKTGSYILKQGRISSNLARKHYKPSTVKYPFPPCGVHGDSQQLHSIQSKMRTVILNKVGFNRQCQRGCGLTVGRSYTQPPKVTTSILSIPAAVINSVIQRQNINWIATTFRRIHWRQWGYKCSKTAHPRPQ